MAAVTGVSFSAAAFEDDGLPTRTSRDQAATEDVVHMKMAPFKHGAVSANLCVVVVVVVVVVDDDNDVDEHDLMMRVNMT
jgi:hypothetical protein